MKEIINPNPLFIPQFWDIDHALKAMIDRNVSSGLVYNEDEIVVGIITEKDILKKLPLLDIDRKLGRKINTIMTRPVKFVHLSSLEQDVVGLHDELEVRNFPILSTDGVPHKDNIAGMITFADIARHYLDQLLIT